jgi:hypothetical protein
MIRFLLEIQLFVFFRDALKEERVVIMPKSDPTTAAEPKEKRLG